MSNQLIQLGVGGMFSIFILREVLTFLKYILNRKSEKLPEVTLVPNEMARLKLIGHQVHDIHNNHKKHVFDDARAVQLFQQTDELHKLHSIKDEDGVPVWYVRKSLEKAINNLSENVARQTSMMIQVISKLEKI